MSRRYWVPIFALIGLIALTGASPSNDPNVSPNADPKAEHIPSPPAPTTPAEDYSPYPDRNADGCYDDKNHDRADLCAQWRAAIAAEKAAKATTWGNVISGIGAGLSFLSSVLVVVAIWQTRKANKISAREYARSRVEAKGNMKQSERALEIASAALLNDREIGEAQVRAYIIFEPTTLELVEMNGVSAIPRLHFTLTNNGNSPAHKILVFATRQDTSDALYGDGAGTDFETLRSGASVDGNVPLGDAFPVATAPNTWRGTNFIVKVKFFDVFDKAHRFEQTYMAIVGRNAVGQCRVIAVNDFRQWEDMWRHEHPDEK